MLDQFIVNFANKAIRRQCSDGSMPAGHNGPYEHKETPVRNTGHWILIFSKAFELSGDRKFLACIENAANYVISKSAMRDGKYFYHRINGGDDSNGLIGQAWSIESLITASKILENDKYVEMAESIYFKHPYINKHNVWRSCNADKRLGKIDYTFNHQLWFASTSAMLNGQGKELILSRAESFLSNINDILLQFEDGLIYHGIYRRFDLVSKAILIAKSAIKLFLLTFNNYNLDIKEIKKNNLLINKSVGYHSFNMYAFSLLKSQIPNHPFWDSAQFSSMLKFLLSKEYTHLLEFENYYGLPYNVPGFEIPVIAEVFGGLKNDELLSFSEGWINKQINLLYNEKTKWFDNNNSDPNTLSARFYEITRLSNAVIKNINVTL